MTSRLIINADDFGLTHGVNAAIADLFHAGALSSTTLMANSRAFLDAAGLANALPGMGVGCHIVLVDGNPLCVPANIPTLLAHDCRRLQPSLKSFARDALLGRLDEADIEREASAQVTRLLDAGITPTHLDTHKHTHMYPAVLRPLLRVAERFAIPAIRNPFEQAWSLRIGRGRTLRRLQIRLLGLLERNFHEQVRLFRGRITTTDGAIGVSATGDLDATTLASLLDALPPGTWEFVCHPGFYDQDLNNVETRLRAEREVERRALLDIVQQSIAEKNIELVSYRALAAEAI